MSDTVFFPLHSIRKPCSASLLITGTVKCDLLIKVAFLLVKLLCRYVTSKTMLGCYLRPCKYLPPQIVVVGVFNHCSYINSLSNRSEQWWEQRGPVVIGFALSINPIWKQEAFGHFSPLMEALTGEHSILKMHYIKA